MRRCLDEDHLGLEKVKKRIVEYSAIRQLRTDKKGPILLFIGPPGVGKTSLGKSIARAMGRRYERIALGGVRDEAEIRGHRRTYVGALPGRILQALKKAGTKNPVLVLDEVDKMGVDLRGDPAAALLEVLDPEQNATFQDHYLDLPFDLSQVMFLATANNRGRHPGAALDRMEVIEVPGYTRDRQARHRAASSSSRSSSRAHGLTDERLEFTDDGVARSSTLHARGRRARPRARDRRRLPRTAVKIAEGDDVREVATPEHVEKVLGPQKHRPESPSASSRPASPRGSPGRPAGGDILFIEATQDARQGQRRPHRQHAQRHAGVGHHRGLVRAQQGRALGTSIPSGSRRSTCTCTSRSTGRPRTAPAPASPCSPRSPRCSSAARSEPDVAMTGEISLRGRVMPVGGIKEKLLAAHRAGIKQVLIPKNGAISTTSRRAYGQRSR